MIRMFPCSHGESPTSLSGPVLDTDVKMATKSTPDVSSDPAPHLVSQATPPPPEGTGEKVSRQERRRKERIKRNRKGESNDRHQFVLLIRHE